MSKDSKRPKNKERPLPGSAHKYLERHNERLTELESVKSRKGEGMKGFKKRISEMRPGSRHPDRKKGASVMWQKLAEELGLPDDPAPLDGDAHSEYYQDKEKKNKSGTKADEATDPDAKDDLAKAGFWEGVVKMARAQGLDTIQTLGLCASMEGSSGETPNDPYIYSALLKRAEDDLDDMEGCGEGDDLKRLHNVEKEEKQQVKEIVQNQEVQTSQVGSPLQDPMKKEETELAELKANQEIQYEGTGPVDNHDPKEAAFYEGMNEILGKQAAYGDLGFGGTLGQAAKYGLGGPLSVATAPFSIPMSMLQAGGGVAGANLPLDEMGDDRSTKLMGGQGAAHMLHPSSASLLRRLDELKKADPALAEKFQEHLSSIRDDDRYTGTSEAAAYIPAAMSGMAQVGTLGAGTPGALLHSAISGSGGQARFAEGLGGDQAGFMRRWFDPTGYSTKNIAYELQQKDPELAAQMLGSLQGHYADDAQFKESAFQEGFEQMLKESRSFGDAFPGLATTLGYGALGAGAGALGGVGYEHFMRDRPDYMRGALHGAGYGGAVGAGLGAGSRLAGSGGEEKDDKKKDPKLRNKGGHGRIKKDKK